MNVYAIAISFVLFPLALVIVSIRVLELSPSLCFIVDPLTFIDSSIWPLLLTISISHISKPFSFVLDSIFKSYNRFFFSLDASVRIILFFESLLQSILLIIIIDMICYFLILLELVIFDQKISIIFLFRGLNLGWLQIDLLGWTGSRRKLIIGLTHKSFSDGFRYVVAVACRVAHEFICIMNAIKQNQHWPSKITQNDQIEQLQINDYCIRMSYPF